MPNYVCIVIYVNLCIYAFFYISWKIQCREYGLPSQFWAYKSFWRVRLDKVWWSKMNIFLQQKCSWNVTYVLKHRSTDHWLRWECTIIPWPCTSPNAQLFWWVLRWYRSLFHKWAMRWANLPKLWVFNSLLINEYVETPN